MFTCIHKISKKELKMTDLLNVFRFSPFNTLEKGIEEITKYLSYKPSKEENECIKMVLFLKSYDEDTYLHSLEVALLNYEIAKRLDQPLSIQHDLFYGGLIHDCGKIIFSKNLFNGSNQLTDDERKLIKNHPIIGHKLANIITQNPIILKSVLEHHEYLDGTGYPYQKEDLSLQTQIVTISDIFSAITRKRQYRKKVVYNVREAITELESMKNKINQDIVSVLREMMIQKKQVAI